MPLELGMNRAEMIDAKIKQCPYGIVTKIGRALWLVSGVIHHSDQIRSDRFLFTLNSSGREVFVVFSVVLVRLGRNC